jgi:hypothetical protein
LKYNSYRGYKYRGDVIDLINKETELLLFPLPALLPPTFLPPALAAALPQGPNPAAHYTIIY